MGGDKDRGGLVPYTLGLKRHVVPLSVLWRGLLQVMVEVLRRPRV